MDADGFRQFLKETRHPDERINQHIQIIAQFEAFLVSDPSKSNQHPTTENTLEYISFLTAVRKDTYDNIAALARYGLFTSNRPLYLTALQFVDGGEVMDNLYTKVADCVGTGRRDQIFHDVQLPTIGTPVEQRPAIMKTVIDRMVELLDEQIFSSILSGSLRTLKDEWYQDGRQKYLESTSLDEYLDRRSIEYIAELEQIKNEGRLYFNQEITDEVIEFVRSQPEMARGVREGNILYAVKIPYMAKEYIHEQNQRMKRYYGCHCPWVRESIKTGKETVSPRFCLCSAGFEKKPWEVIFDQPLQAEVVESILNGDLRCKFAIHLPENI